MSRPVPSTLSGLLSVRGARLALLIPDDRSRGAGAGAPGIAVVPTGTPVQIAIKVVLNYNGPIRSVTRCALVSHHAVTDSMFGHSENYCGMTDLNAERAASSKIYQFLAKPATRSARKSCWRF